MNELRRFILESHLDPRFARAVFESLWMLEAVSINKDFLIREAGSPEEFRAAKEIVLHHWNAANMNEQLNQKTAQRVLNLLLLMEIREPGFTELLKLRAIHDLYIHNMLDTKFLNVVNSDSTPEQAEEALKNAVAYQVQQQKTYPDLSEEEESELPESEQLKNDAGDNVRVDAGGPLQPSLIEAHPHTTSELMEAITGLAVDAPLCMTCGTKMRPSGSCYVCEGCGSTSGCS